MTYANQRQKLTNALELLAKFERAMDNHPDNASRSLTEAVSILAAILDDSTFPEKEREIACNLLKTYCKKLLHTPCNPNDFGKQLGYLNAFRDVVPFLDESIRTEYKEVSDALCVKLEEDLRQLLRSMSRWEIEKWLKEVSAPKSLLEELLARIPKNDEGEVT